MNNGNYNIEKYKKGSVAFALHALIWLMVFLIPYIFSANIEGNSNHKVNDQHGFLRLNTIINLFWLALFYLNTGLLIPRLFYKKKVLIYLLVLAGIFCIVTLFDKILFGILMIPHVFSLYHSVENNFIPFVFTIVVSAAYKAISDKAKTDKWIQDKQSENLKTELSFLRSQINPHFLFNVLNNIVALVRIKSSDLEPTVLKLSSLMQYMLYETDEEKMVLKK